MAQIYENILELIGKTPLVKLNKINTGFADVAVKLEYFNPGNSVKDRPALNMIEKAEQEGLIDKDTVIIEPTKRQYRYRTRPCLCGKRLQTCADNARKHEC